MFLSSQTFSLYSAKNSRFSTQGSSKNSSLSKHTGAGLPRMADHYRMSKTTITTLLYAGRVLFKFLSG